VAVMAMSMTLRSIRWRTRRLAFRRVSASIVAAMVLIFMCDVTLVLGERIEV